MEVEFVATVAVIAPDPALSRELYAGALGLPLGGSEDDGYQHTEAVEGLEHFGVWPLSQAAEACFGSPEWPAGRPVPQASIEFDLASPDAVAAAAQELQGRGFDVLHPARQEPWGQTVARLQGPEGMIVGVAFTPGLRRRG